MMPQPPYFEPIREAAAKRWEQLERDPELAAPWHLLFKQVQSPRHVLSELLQNADDAEATETWVRVADGAFIFTHNGCDFVEEHFASLCRFGYSNKRALHTIGFRGIGFKSTFSLGDTVELSTPTLSVGFQRERFTEPQWIPVPAAHLTQVRVRIDEERREREIRKNLEDWLRSPLSLLFFNHIRKMRIDNRELHWERLGPGPVSQSEWMALNGNAAEAYLIARSAPEVFPEDALHEIRQERQVTEDQLREFPPCNVEIVHGAKGQLFVVLPTGVETALPFACNAPFIQDPSRLKIKDPEISPTNRWLLERIGNLAGSVMLEWLGQHQATVAERSRAYGIFPDVDREDNSLEGTCTTVVGEAFGQAITDQPFLMTDAGDMVKAKEAVIVPDELLDVWSEGQITAFLDKADRSPFSRHVSRPDREKLIHWGLIEEIGKNDVLATLQVKHLPKPESWRRLLNLWAYIAPDVTGYNWLINKRAIRIVPVQSKDVLYSASEVVRLAEKRLLQSDDDWEFLAAHLLVLNQNWPRFLAEQRRTAEESGDETAKKDVAVALAVLIAIGLNDANDVSAVVDQVAADFFRQDSVPIGGCVQLAQIAAKLGANVGGSFRFVSQDLHLRAIDAAVLWDPDGALGALLPKGWCSAHLLHPEYLNSFKSCTKEEWVRWVSTGRAGILGFTPLVQKRLGLWSRNDLEVELRRRGVDARPYYPYVTSHFVIEDWDFDQALWNHWANLSKGDPNVWAEIVERLLAQPDSFWTKAKSARALQIATTGTMKTVVDDFLSPSWLLRLRKLPCLPDTRGLYHNPEALLLRTPETEPLLDVELFLHARLDREASRPLLNLLGARDTPTGPDRLLDCLRALAKSQKPPVYEVEKWYRRLDQLIDTSSTADLTNIKDAFRDEKIILTEGGAWTNVSGVFLSSDEEDVPGAEIVRTSVQDLALWRKLGIAERPTVELAVQWLKQLPSGVPLSQNDARRVRSLLARHAVRIWHECEHWLNLAGEWVPVTTLGYALTMQSLVPWSHLHEWVKQKTADLQRLPAQITEVPPFSDLPHLAGHIEERFQRNPLIAERPAKRAWLNQLGAELRRVELESEAETAYVRARAAELATTVWQNAPGLEVIPYIGGVPAGTPRQTEAIWLDKVLYIEDRPPARLARAVSQELRRAFQREDIADAIKFCFDRQPDFVTEYVEENFRLISRTALDVSGDEQTDSGAAGQRPDAEVPEASPATTVSTADEITATSDASEQADHCGVEAAEEQAAQDHEEPVNGEATQRSHPHPRPGKASIIERFAGGHGFQKDGDNRFFHPDGSWIAKPAGARFWERRSANGDLIRNYWPKDHCLQRDPLQIEADVWGLIDKFPDTYALILSNEQDDAVEITGARLRAMRDEGDLTLYPATYRLVLRS